MGSAVQLPNLNAGRGGREGEGRGIRETAAEPGRQGDGAGMRGRDGG